VNEALAHWGLSRQKQTNMPLKLFALLSNHEQFVKTFLNFCKTTKNKVTTFGKGDGGSIVVNVLCNI